MPKRRIALIGGSGFIGSRLYGRLMAAGHEPYIVDIVKSDVAPADWRHGDVRDIVSLESVLANADVVVNLAAIHHDNVRPISLYDETNVVGAANVCAVARKLGIRDIIFTSSVAIYGFSDVPTSENGEARYFNDYGRTKWEAEQVFRSWASESSDRNLTVIRPTVVFGEGNRGNVYNLLEQLANGPPVMLGDGTNKKSMAYVENVAAFIEYCISTSRGVRTFNYVDPPDLDMNSLVSIAKRALQKSERALRVPYPVALMLGICADGLGKITGKQLPISKVRVQKFCSSTVFDATRAHTSGFTPPVQLAAALSRTINFEFGDQSGAKQ